MRSSFVITLLLCSLTWAQLKQESRTLVIDGKRGNVAVVQINGHTYVDLLGLVQIANGSMEFQGTEIVLTLPQSKARSHEMPSQSEQPVQSGFSGDFVKAGLEALTLMREWASPLANAIQNGFPVTDSWVSAYRDKAASGLRLASVAASTAADQHALELLKNEFENVRQWSDRLVEARKSMSAANYALSPNALHDDPVSQKIMACAHFLASILENGNPSDDPSCH